jgi:hypothetical protein
MQRYCHEHQGLEHQKDYEGGGRTTIENPGQRARGNAEADEGEEYRRGAASSHDRGPVGEAENAGTELDAFEETVLLGW